MNESILTSVKKLLGITEDYEQFDIDIIIHINTVFMILNQLGVGPTNCFSISDKSAVWSDFLGDSADYEAVRTYVYLKVRLLFDPPTNGSAIDATNRMIEELEWRLFVNAELEGSDNVTQSRVRLTDTVTEKQYDLHVTNGDMFLSEV